MNINRSFKLLSNVHTHTYYCDGKNSPGEMAQKAYELGYKTLGFSFHSPLPYENNYAVREEKLGEYLSEIEKLKGEYEGKIEILSGVEFDIDSYGTGLDLKKLDYAIGSVHQIHDRSKIHEIDTSEQNLSYCINNMFCGDALSMVEHYFSLVEKVALLDEINIVGHFDVITKANDNFFDENSEKYKSIALSSLERICKARPEIVFEVNTGGIYKHGKKLPYPSPFILSRLAQLRQRIMINIDAHDTNSLAFDMDPIIKLLRECGFDSVVWLRRHGFEEVKI